MSTQIGAPVRIVALVGLVAALGLAAWMFTAGRGAGAASSAASETPVALHPVAAARSVAAKLSAHTAATKPDVVRQARTKVAAKPVHRAKLAAAKPSSRTPRTIAALLRTNRVVVVLLYNPQSKVDEFSVGEAALGASRAKAGFLRVDVLDQRQALPFTQAYGVLQDPTVLFFARPGKLVQKLAGFADHDTVAQAALNAALGLGVNQR